MRSIIDAQGSCVSWLHALQVFVLCWGSKRLKAAAVALQALHNVPQLLWGL
jgi:hypothetical protein